MPSRMRVLIVSGFFPPYAPMSGVRAGKLAKYLLSRGHDVRVLAAKNESFPPLLRLEIPDFLVHYSRVLDVNGLPRRLATFMNRAGGGGGPASAQQTVFQGNSKKSVLRSVLRRSVGLYQNLTNWPDPQIGWLPYAVADGTKLLREWRADIIYATVPPLTGVLVARRLARRFSVPWIAEFRDLWIDHPYYDAPAWRRPIERLHEARALQKVSGIVTVSNIWRTLLADRFGKPTITVLNGYDPDDYSDEPVESGSSADALTIVYTGTLYPGRRDPTPLFQAVARLGERGRKVQMKFYGADPVLVFSLAKQAGVSAQVEAPAAVAYDRAVALQRAADILLLLRWNDPSEQGIVPGKLFEYAGARRPILCLGYEQGDVPDLMRSRGLGLVSEDPEIIASQLALWITEKSTHGQIAPLPPESRVGLSRLDQFEKLEQFISSISQNAH